MFRGRYETTVDKKGRTSLPARYRENLAATDDIRMVLTTSLDPCIMAYTYTEWCEFEKNLASHSSFDKEIVRFKRRFISRAVECPVDGHGRILIPQMLRDYAGITRNVIWSGMLNSVELWDPSRLEETMQIDTDPSDVDQIRETMAKYGL